MTDSQKRIIQEYYSSRAKNYDRQKKRTWNSDSGFAPEVTDNLVKSLRDFDNRTILELGVGTGRNAKPLLEQIGIHFIGLDLTKQMLRKAKKKLEFSRKQTDLILADAEKTPFTSKSFDAILCLSTMHYFSNQRQMVRNLAILLKNGGTFICGDLSLHESDDEGFFEELERTVSGAHGRYFKASEMKKLIENSGFAIAGMSTVPYRKQYDSLMEDKAVYFDVRPNSLLKLIRDASIEAKKNYALTETSLTQHYTIIVAVKQEEAKE